MTTWKRTEDERPDTHRDVIVLRRGRVVPEIGYYLRKQHWTGWVVGDDGVRDVSHWQELPEPPTE